MRQYLDIFPAPEKTRTHNSTFAIRGVSCSEDSFMVAESLVLRINICGENRHLRVAANRCMKPLTNITHKYDVKEEMENKKTFCKALCGTKTVRGIY